jgi:ABC-2 type transport system permease protein
MSAGAGKRGGRWMRLRALIRKEFLQIVRDPSSIGIAFLMPAVLLVIFGYGVSLDADDIPIALVVEQPSPDTESFVGQFSGSKYFRPTRMNDMRAAEQALQEGRVDGIVRLRSDFARTLNAGGEAPVQLIVNGVDANTARLVIGYAEGAWLKWLEQRSLQAGQPLSSPVELEPRIWFNSELRSRDFLVPGLVVVVMTLIGAMLTAMVMAREWERGTMEALLVTPVRMNEVLLGKLIPYFLLGMAGSAVTVLMAVWLFGVPLRGSLWVLTVTSSLFMLTALGMGLLISSFARSQFIAGQTAIIVTYLPAFLLSGFIFDIRSMPWVVRAITRITAARYFVAIVQTVFLAGDVWSVILPNSLALVIMAIVFLSLTRMLSRKRLA